MSRVGCWMGLMMTLGWVWGADSKISQGYELFLRNELDSALQVFRQLNDPGGKVLVWNAIGNADSTVQAVIDHTESEWDPDALMLEYVHLLGPIRDQDPRFLPKIQAILQQLRKRFPGHPIRYEMEIELLLTQIRKDKTNHTLKQLDSLGVIRKWWWAGPFENVSNSGVLQKLPPEQGFQGEETYGGLSALPVSWRSFESQSPLAWIRMDELQGIGNAVNFFATTLKSPQSQQAFLSFGASGSFAVWLNGKRLAYQEIFQNLGAEGIRIPIKLRKGKNHLLIKLGHEMEMYSNFVVRLSDKKGQPLSLSAAPGPQSAVHYGAVQGLAEPSSWEMRWQKRMQKDSSDLEALLQLACYWVKNESFQQARRPLSLLQKRYPYSAWVAARWAELYQREGNFALADQYQRTAYDLDSTLADSWIFHFNRLVFREDAPGAVQAFANRPPRLRASTQQIFDYIKACLATHQDSLVWVWVDSLKQNRRWDSDALIYASGIEAALGDRQKSLQMLQAWGDRIITFPGVHYELVDRYRSFGMMPQCIVQLKDYLAWRPHDTHSWFLLADAYFSLQDWASVEKVCLQGLQYNPWHSGLWLKMARAREMMGKPLQAVQAYRQTLALPGADFQVGERVIQLLGHKEHQALRKVFALQDLRKEARQWKQGQDENSRILLKHRSLRAYEWGGTEQWLRLVAEVKTPRGVDQWKELDGWDWFRSGSLEVMRAVTHTQAGRTLEADISSSRVVFKGLEPGDLVELDIRVQEKQGGELAGQFWAQHHFGSSVPVLYNVFEIFTPHNLSYQIAQRHLHLQPVQQKLVQEGLEVKRFEQHNIQGTPAESAMPDWGDALPSVTVSTLTSWDQIGQWYAGLSEGKIVESFELRALADSLFQGIAKTPKGAEEKVRRVQEFLVQKIRYSHQPFRQSGYVPQSATKTLVTRIGDCKDMATLGKALLRLGGVESELVLVNTNDQEREAPLPMDLFNHCILWVNVRKGTFIDFTADQNGWRDLPRLDQGGLMVRIRPHAKTKLEHLPFTQSNDRIQRDSWDTLKVSGDYKRSMRTIRSGVMAADYRHHYRDRSSQRTRESALQSLQTRFSHVTLDSLLFENLDSINQDLQYRMDYTVKNWASRSDHFMTVEIPWSDALLPEDVPGEETRHFDWLVWKHWKLRGNFEQTIHLTLPSGWKLAFIPDPLDVRGAFGHYRRRVRPQKNGVVLLRSFDGQYRSVSPQDFPAEKQKLQEAVAKDRLILVLQKESVRRSQ